MRSYLRITKYAFVIMFVFTQCEDKENITTVDLYPDKIIEKYSDNFFIGNIRDIETNLNKIYFSDLESGAIVVLDSSLNYISTISKKGFGPGELVNPGNVSVISDSVYVADKAGKNINVFSLEGKYGRTFQIDSRILKNDFTVKGDSIYIVNYLGDSLLTSVAILNMKGRLVRSFGGVNDSEIQNVKYTLRHIFKSDNGSIISVPFTTPMIEYYSKPDYNYSKIDFSELGLLSEKWEKIKRLQDEHTMSGGFGHIMHYTDAYYNQQYLYLSTSGGKGYSPMIVVEETDSSLKPRVILNLHTEINSEDQIEMNPMAIAANDSSIIVFNFFDNKVYRYKNIIYDY